MDGQARGTQILAWGQPENFEKVLRRLLRASALHLEVLRDWQEVARVEPEAYAGLLVDGEWTGGGELLISLRQLAGWNRIPIFLLGGQRSALTDATGAECRALPEQARELELLFLDEKALRRWEGQTFEKRSFYRLSCGLTTTVELMVQLLDFSEGGAQLESPLNVPPGTLLAVHLRGLNPELREPLRFRVLHVRRWREAYRLHGKFEELSQALQKKLRRTLLRVELRLANRKVLPPL